MAETTAIAWTDSTFNPWIGCTKVSDGCDNCYAAVSRPAQAMKIKWGSGEKRHRTSADYWKQPLAWNRKAEASGKRHLVFCASLADVFDNEVPEDWRRDLFVLIDKTPSLTWLLLTKRIGNAAKMLPWDWTSGPTRPWHNIWIGASVVNQEEAYRDIPKLLSTPATKRFVSYEPALGPVNFKPWLKPCGVVSPDPHGRDKALDWVIVGGESSHGGAAARPFDLAWARDTVRQCKTAGVSVFVKQLGSNISGAWEPHGCPFPKPTKDRAGADPAEWPEDLRLQEFPQ